MCGIRAAFTTILATFDPSHNSMARDSLFCWNGWQQNNKIFETLPISIMSLLLHLVPVTAVDEGKVIMVRVITKGKRDSDDANFQVSRLLSSLNHLDNKSPGNDRKGINLKALEFVLKRCSSRSKSYSKEYVCGLMNNTLILVCYCSFNAVRYCAGRQGTWM